MPVTRPARVIDAFAVAARQLIRVLHLIVDNEHDLAIGDCEHRVAMTIVIFGGIFLAFVEHAVRTGPEKVERKLIARQKAVVGVEIGDAAHEPAPGDGCDIVDRLFPPAYLKTAAGGFWRAVGAEIAGGDDKLRRREIGGEIMPRGNEIGVRVERRAASERGPFAKSRLRSGF